ncbi:MAG: hypothetical protein AB7F96_14565 [Beijerinckiaceae bacterium]
MAKVFGFAVGAVLLCVGAVQGVNLQRATETGYSGSPGAPGGPTIGQLLQHEADKLNKKKGEKNGHSVFDGAYVQGSTMTLEYIVNINPRYINSTKAGDKLRKQMVNKFCRGQARNTLRKGATFVVAYRAKKNNQFLFEVRFSDANCNEAA